MFPITGTPALVLAVVFGFAFGWLLHRGRVTSYDTILGQFRLTDYTVLKVMGTAIVVGGLGVFALVDLGLAKYAVRETNLLGTVIGAAIFGVGMVLYGYCPGTGLAAVGTGSVHALVGAVGMLAGAVVYAFSFDAVRDAILGVGKMGKVTLSDLTGIPPLGILFALAVLALAGFWAVETFGPQPRGGAR